MSPATRREGIIHMNARIRAMKSRLFSRAQLEGFLEQEEVSLLVENLLNSPYEDEMREALSRHREARAVEEAVSRNLVRTVRRLLEWADHVFPVLCRFFLLRWDLIAVKTVLRARRAQEGGLPAFDDALCVGPTLRADTVANLARLETMGEVVENLARWNALLAARLAVQTDEPGAASVENALDRAYFVDGPASLAGGAPESTALVCRLIAMEVDRINLRTLFCRGEGGREAMEDRLLPGGTLVPRVLRGMMGAPGPAEAMEFLGPTPYRGLVEVLFRLLQTGQFSPMERMFDGFILKYLGRASRRNDLDMSLLAHYTWLKYNEIVNIRLIAQGEARHLPRGRIREELVFA